MSLHVGVDIGGTFTDTISFDETGAVLMSKVPTTGQDQSVGFLEGLDRAQILVPEIAWLVHGTTVGTNATLERTGARCGMITTKGFRDVIELGRRERPNLFGLFGRYEPLILREHRLEVDERMDADGEILVPLDEGAVETAALHLKDAGIEAVLVCFLNSYANPRHERRAAEIVSRVWGSDYVTQSVDILGEFREVERFGTAAINAYIQPLIDRYVRRLTARLEDRGLRLDLAIMQANGGIMSSETACRRAVNTVLSGPAAGVIAATSIAKQSGHPNVVTCDMGGTSFDVGIILDGRPVVTSDRDLGFNLPMRIPIIDIHTIGAGGGSIGRVDEAGMLQVGPRSAGSFPGPIAYGRGGELPTVTDANVLLGRLPADDLLGTQGRARTDLIEAAFQRLGAPIGLDAMQAADAVLRVVNDAMAGAIRLVTLQRGHDPRDFALFGFGGAGPLHGVAIAKALGVPKVIVPYLPGLTCALGCIVADVRHDFVRTIGRSLDDLAESEVSAVLAEQRALGEQRLRNDRVPVDEIAFTHEADMHYEGQTYTLRVPLDPDRLSVDDLRELLRLGFAERFGIDLGGYRPKLANLRTAVVGTRQELDLRRMVSATLNPLGIDEARIGSRPVWFDGAFVETPIYRRDALPVGATLAGPAIFNQMDTTTISEPGDRIRIDDLGNLLIEVGR